MRLENSLESLRRYHRHALRPVSPAKRYRARASALPCGSVLARADRQESLKDFFIRCELGLDVSGGEDTVRECQLCHCAPPVVSRRRQRAQGLVHRGPGVRRCSVVTGCEKLPENISQSNPWIKQ